jgi:transcriptional regulator with XRE-family HTH domain
MNGQKLKDYLSANSIQINELADKLNMSRQTLYTWLKGDFSKIQKKKVIDALNLPIDFFDEKRSESNSHSSNDYLLQMLKNQTEALAKCNEEKEVLLREIIELQKAHDIEIKSPSSALYSVNEPLSKQSKLTIKTKDK